LDGWHGGCFFCVVSGATDSHKISHRIDAGTRPGGLTMYNVFYIIGVVVVVLAILGYFGFR
jgi:hypothetical protein